MVARSKGPDGKKKSSDGSREPGKSHRKITTAGESRAGRFAERFIKSHPDTFHELSKR